MSSKALSIALCVGLGCMTSQASFASTTTYRLTVLNTWTSGSYPVNYPDDAYFSWLGGGTHDATVSIWQLGGIATTADRAKAPARALPLTGARLSTYSQFTNRAMTALGVPLVGAKIDRR